MWELIGAGLSAAAEICHRARESPCIRTSYEIQRQLQHKVPRVQHLSRWHKCLPHTVHSTGHSKSSWVLWALIGLDLARTMCLKWGTGWHCPGLNWKSFNLLRSAFPLKARSLQNTLRAFGLWRTGYNEVQWGDFSSPSFIYFAAWTLHSTNAERLRSQKGLKTSLLRCLGMLWQFIVQVSCSQTTAIKSTAYSDEESPIWLIHKMTNRFSFVAFLGCTSRLQTKSYRVCSAFIAALELINTIFVLVINEWILICSFHQILFRIFLNLFIGQSNIY